MQAFLSKVKAKIYAQTNFLNKVYANTDWENVTSQEVESELLTIYHSLENWWGQGEASDEELRKIIESRIQEYKEKYRAWHFPLKIYRGLYLNDINDLSLDNLGNSWGPDEGAAISHQGSTNDGDHFQLKSSVQKHEIDWVRTLAENITYGEVEREVYVKTGTPLLVEAYRKGKSNTGNWIPLNKKGKA